MNAQNLTQNTSPKYTTIGFHLNAGRPDLSFVQILHSPRVSEFKGKRYVWPKKITKWSSKGEAVVPADSPVAVYLHVAHSRKYRNEYLVIGYVKEGEKTEHKEFTITNFSAKKIINPWKAEREKASMLNDGYSYSSTRYVENLAGYLIMKLEEKKPVTTEKKSEVLARLENLEKELEEAEEKTEKEVKVTKEDIIKYLQGQGMERIKLIVFDLPTEYRKSKTKLEKGENGEWREIKILRYDPARFRSLRRKFYAILEKIAYKTSAGWALLPEIKDDHPMIKEMNKTIEELERISGVPRIVEIIETWMPKDYVIRQLEKYINAREFSLKDVEEKLKLEKLKSSEKKRLQRRLEELSEIVKKLKQELARLKGSQL